MGEVALGHSFLTESGALVIIRFPEGLHGAPVVRVMGGSVEETEELEKRLAECLKGWAVNGQ
jgi:hypothetical protein